MQFFQSTFPFIILSAFTPVVLLLLRILLAIIFVDSGRRHIADPKGRGKELGLSAILTFTLGASEVVAGTLVFIGLWIHIATLILMIVMLGAMYFKIFIWKTGIYGDNNNGWYYDALLFADAGILSAIGAGPISIAWFLHISTTI